MSNHANYVALKFKHRKRLSSTRLTSERRQIKATHFLPETAVVQRRAACVCGGGCPRCLSLAPIQAQLKIGQPDDKYEQEADRVADQVMNMPAGQIQRQVEEEQEEGLQAKPLTGQITPLVQRQVPEEEEEEEILQTKRQSTMIHRQTEVEEEEEQLQTKSAGNRSPKASANLSAGIQALRGGGRTLTKSSRSFFESCFGHNFSQVRVHTDSRAADIARAINARAFTWQEDIVFAPGQYAPDTREGRRLLAHELTHVVQQSRTTSASKTKPR